MEHWFAVIAGGGLGALSRYVLSSQVSQLVGGRFPWGTLTVNVIGSFLAGFLVSYLAQHMQHMKGLYPALIVGYLGALTTFSSFSLENLYFIQQGEVVRAMANILVNVFGCLLAVFFGFFLGR